MSAESDSETFGAAWTPEDVRTLERAAESLVRLGDVRGAIPLWALALKVRLALNLPPETVEVHRG